MIKSFQSVLSPLLIIGYVCGIKIFEFPRGHPKKWCSLLYVLLLWSIYFLLLIYTFDLNSYTAFYRNIDLIGIGLNLFITLIVLVYVAYYDKKFRKCIKRIEIVDDTLEQLGTTTNYQKLHKRILWLIAGWFVIFITENSLESLCLKHQHNFNIITIIYVPFLINYALHINVIDDLIIITILSYIGLKFDQINENLRRVTKNNKDEITQVKKNRVSQSHQPKLLRTLNKNHIVWIVIHLHSELCKISREVNSIFGLQMTLKVGLHFGFIAGGLSEIFNTIFIKNYINQRGEYLVLILYWIIINTLKLFFINYVCEKVCSKASATGNIINNATYSIYDVDIRENILQLLLQLTQAPLGFYGLGLFQFGFKFLQRFLTSIATVLTILVQAHIKK